MMTAVTQQWIKVQKYFVDFIFALASAAINQVQQFPHLQLNFPLLQIAMQQNLQIW